MCHELLYHHLKTIHSAAVVDQVICDAVIYMSSTASVCMCVSKHLQATPSQWAAISQVLQLIDLRGCNMLDPALAPAPPPPSAPQAAAQATAATSTTLVPFTAPPAAPQAAAAAAAAAAAVQVDAQGWACLDIGELLAIDNDEGSSLVLTTCEDEANDEVSSFAMTLDGVPIDLKTKLMLQNTEPLPAGRNGISKAAKAAKAAAQKAGASKVKAKVGPQKTVAKKAIRL